MNNYSERARFYQYEFNSVEDFGTIEYLIARSGKSIAEIPCGSGRLIYLYEKYPRIIYMVDREPQMILKCKELVTKKQLTNRIFPLEGDLRSWKSPENLQLLLIPRGGIQLLESHADIENCLLNLGISVENGGLIYLDIASPWNSSLSGLSILPEFMRFTDQTKITGESVFVLESGGQLIRKFKSVLEKQYVNVELKFFAELPQQSHVVKYKSKFRWIRLELKELSTFLERAGFLILETYGDYDFGRYKKKSARIICIAKKIK